MIHEAGSTLTLEGLGRAPLSSVEAAQTARENEVQPAAGWAQWGSPAEQLAEPEPQLLLESQVAVQDAGIKSSDGVPSHVYLNNRVSVSWLANGETAA